MYLEMTGTPHFYGIANKFMSSMYTFLSYKKVVKWRIHSAGYVPVCIRGTCWDVYV